MSPDEQVAVEVFGEERPSGQPIVVSRFSMATIFESYEWKAWHPELVNSEWVWVARHFGSSIKEAWLVVDWLRHLGWEVGMVSSTTDGVTTWNANAYNSDLERRCGDCGHVTRGRASETADTAPEAIRLVALAAFREGE